MNVAPRIAAYLKGPAFSLWTFIKYFERSKDPAHCRRLKRQMEAELRNLHRAGLVVKCKSIRGKAAYRSRDDYPDEVPF